MFYINSHAKKFQITEQSFPDGTLHLSLPDCDPASVVWHYESDVELFTLMCIVDHYGHIPCLYMPYLPHARMDRVKNTTDVFTLKTFAKAINAMGFDRVRMLDVHSNVGMALIDHAEAMPLTLASFHEWAIDEVTERCDGAEPLLFFPDEGAMKRYTDSIGMQYAFGMKRRDWNTGAILGLDIINKELVRGRDILIIDDICSRGGTFYHSAKALKEAGAKSVFLAITHAEKTMLEGEMYNEPGLIEHIFTTDSIYRYESDDKVSVFYDKF